MIDKAARTAGRDAAEVVRMLNVTPQYRADELARLAVEDGVSVFIMGSDDVGELRHFAEVTAEEIRDRVEDARTGGSVRRKSFLVPGDPGYARYTSGYFRGGRPARVLRPQSPAEVQDAVRYAAEHRDLPLGILSGGHGLSGRSINTGGIVLAVDALDEITVLDDGGVRLGPGARWGDVARTLASHGRALTAGDHGGVGVGGLATAGGIGWLVREHGLTIDHLRSVDVVTAAGELVHASATENPDLFWAMRGAGANFGVAVSFEFDTDPIGERVGFAMLAFAPDDIATFLRGWGSAIEASHPSVTGTLMIAPGGPVQALIVVDSGDADTVLERLRPLAGLAPLAGQQVRLTPYEGLLAMPGGPETQHGQGDTRGHSGLVRHLDADVTAGIAGLLDSDKGFLLSVRSAGGAVAEIAPDTTAYAWRDSNFLLATLGGWSTGFEQAWRKLIPSLNGSYLSFETDLGSEAVARAFPPAHLERLRDLKRQWDPTGLFRDNFFIDPAS